MTTRGVRWYLILSFGLFWGWILTMWATGVSLTNPLAQLPGGFAPAIAAFVVRRYVTREGFADARLRLRWRAAWRYYVLAWLAPIGVLAVTVVLAVLFAGYRPSGLGVVAPFVLIALVVPPIFFGEEFGWRSYLQQRIVARPTVAVLVTGLIWGVWHWPLAFTGYADYDNLPLGLATWTVHTLLIGILLGWLFVRSGSVWVTCLAHGCSNLVGGVGAELLLVDDGGMSRAAVDGLSLVPLLALAAVVLGTRQFERVPVAAARE
ncbi:CPBP family intramembrane glutamic endopeptidase [Cryptosporangium aurantiacum]|uniref:CAAX protease self-immunity n=1 Tax=Cryptosporangium aurantiacum TaxID=134849 RepID=A0A1M7RN18_9ACTN|nr:CPBP family intramembrane glutamic endopeptidase [Cryptosporangium aurantiacum]SHN47498.1 CAAX protease self-immunity [Cryptosporangium aurantiacum]